MDPLEILAVILTRIIPIAGAFFVSALSFLFVFYNYEKARDRLRAGRSVEPMTFVSLGVFAFIGSMALGTALYFGVLTVRVILRAGGV